MWFLVIFPISLLIFTLFSLYLSSQSLMSATPHFFHSHDYILLFLSLLLPNRGKFPLFTILVNALLQDMYSHLKIWILAPQRRDTIYHSCLSYITQYYLYYFYPFTSKYHNFFFLYRWINTTFSLSMPQLKDI